LAEVTEYTLAVLFSTILVGGSAVAYATFARFESTSEADASLSALVGLADEAALSGHASSTLLLPSSTLTCDGRIMSLTVGNATVSSALALPCDFVMRIPGGLHDVAFDYRGTGLLLEVS
jgi:hypothetical protein